MQKLSPSKSVKSQIHAPAFYEFAQQILFYARCRAIELNFNFFDKLNPCISQEIHGFLLRQHRTIKAAVLCGNFVLLRLIICPIITVLLLRVIGAASWIPDGHSILLTVYLACITPACATVTSMAQLYDRDAEYSSALYVLTTLFSILTMPLMVWVFEVLI